MLTPSPCLIVVVGLTREARIIEAPGLRVLIGGGQCARLARQIQEAITMGADGLVSFGLCGGLAPDLGAGDLVIASNRPAWLDHMRSALPHARVGQVVGGDAMVARAAEKARLRRDTAADAVDMESHLVIDAASHANLPYAIVRAVSDPAGRDLPSAALVGMTSDGETDVLAVAAALARRPWQLPALLQLGADADRAFKALTAAAIAFRPSLAFF